jgi:hypothetical protein
MTLTGRYKFEPQGPDRAAPLMLYVEERNERGFEWRLGRANDLKALEPEVADGWRFREERDGVLDYSGKRFR